MWYTRSMPLGKGTMHFGETPTCLCTFVAGCINRIAQASGCGNAVGSSFQAIASSITRTAEKRVSWAVYCYPATVSGPMGQEPHEADDSPSRQSTRA